jgi:hypothetical protein
MTEPDAASHSTNTAALKRVARSTDQFTKSWTTVLRALDEIAARDDFAETSATRTLRMVAAEIEALRPGNVCCAIISPGWLTERECSELAAEVAQLTPTGFEHNGKVNVQVGAAALNVLARHAVEDIAGRVLAATLAEPVSATYIVYDRPGQRLPLHLDLADFGEVTMLTCVDRIRPATTSPRPSSTVLCRPDRIDYVDLSVGESLVFRGGRIPHGRTRLLDGERVVLLSIGFGEGTTDPVIR